MKVNLKELLKKAEAEKIEVVLLAGSTIKKVELKSNKLIIK